MLSSEFCKLFKNTYFLEDLQTACSETPLIRSFFKKCCKLDGVKTFNSVRKILSHKYFSVNFEKFLEKLFWRTPPSNHFSHDVVFFPFADQWGLQAKISSFGVAMVNQGKQFTNPFNPVQLWESGGNFIVTLSPHMYPLRHSHSWRSWKKGKTEKFVHVWKFSFHVMVDRELFTYVKNKK